MIFAQQGASWRPKINRFLNENLIDGIIWDPREEEGSRINAIREENSDNYNQVINMIDLKIYYKQFPSSVPKLLNDLDYFPQTIIDRTFLRDSNNLVDLVRNTIEYQVELGVDIMLSPSFYLASFNERIVDKLFDVWEIFSEEMDASNNIPKYISFIFKESALEQVQNLNEFLDDFSDLSNNFDGIYIVVDREPSQQRHHFNASRLSEMLKLIHELSNQGLKVIVGYTGLEGLLYSAVGAHAIGTGWFHNLRRFNREEKGLEPVERGGGRQKKRYTSIKCLYELAIEDQIISSPEQSKSHLYDLVLCDTTLDSQVRLEDIDNINLNDTYTQYVEVLGRYIGEINDLDTIEQKVEYVLTLITEAKANVRQFNEIPAIQRISTEHLDNYHDAINTFSDDNFLII